MTTLGLRTMVGKGCAPATRGGTTGHRDPCPCSDPWRAGSVNGWSVDHENVCMSVDGPTQAQVESWSWGQGAG